MATDTSSYPPSVSAKPHTGGDDVDAEATAPPTCFDESQAFCSGTTAHGISRALGDDPPRPRILYRSVWMLIFIGGLIGFLVLFVNRVDRLSSNPKSTTIENRFSGQVEFPAVTICNLNFVRLSKVAASPYASYLLTSNPILVPFTEDEGAAMGHEMKDMLVSCLFNGATCSAANFTKSILPYPFNQCWTFNGDPQQRKNATRSGAIYGLNLVLDVQQYEYLPTTMDAGFIAVIHEPGQAPPADQGYAVAPGTTAYMAMTRKEFNFLAPPFLPGCDVSKDSDYSQQVCQEDCRVDVGCMVCECRLFGETTEEAMKWPRCTTDAQLQCRYMVFEEGADNTKQLLSACDSACPLACKSFAYDVRTSFSVFPSTNGGATLAKVLNIPAATLRENVASMKLFVTELRTSVETEEGTYGGGDFVSDLGGNLGLFLGVSIMTLVELVEYIGLMVWWCARKHRVGGNTGNANTAA